MQENRNPEQKTNLLLLSAPALQYLFLDYLGVEKLGCAR